MADDKVKVGVVGVGGMGSAHCETVQSVEEIELAAVADINAPRAQQLGEQYEVPHFASHEELIDAGLVDAVVIATPHYFHPPIAIDAFEAGLHVLSEKPIGVRIGKAEEMVEAARKSGKVFSVMFQRRSLSVVRKAAEIVESGQLGEIKRTLLILPLFRSQAYYNSGTWRATWAGEGGGVLMNQAPHGMDVFVMLGGMPSKVFGRCDTLMHEIEVEDHAEAMLEYPNGAAGYFYCSTCEAGQRAMEFVGDKGKLRLAGGKLSAWRYEPSVSEFSRTTDEMWGSPSVEPLELECEEGGGDHADILRSFARAILYDEPQLAPGEVGVGSLELSNAIILSSRRGEPVGIPIDRDEYNALIDELSATSKFKGDWLETRSETDPEFTK
ncbi:MAG: Gfo/Idh/MocA family protein [Planctomycetota bacterium]|jgi:predicted dehydrogenase